MEYRRLDITGMSAYDLKVANWFTKMGAYVEVSLGGDPRTKWQTGVDGGGGNNPRWNDSLGFLIEAAALNDLNLVFEIKSKRALCDRDVGWVIVPLKVLFNAADQRVVEYGVTRPSGKLKGILRFSYKFGDKIAAPAYRAHVGASTAYPPPSVVGMAVPYAHPAGHGYTPQPPPPYGYAPPMVQAQPPPRRKQAGPLGPLGMLLLSDMISNDSEMGAYDDDFGFGDADFDF